MKVMIVCVALGVTAVLAAKERKSSIQLGASASATAYEPKVDPSSVTLDRGNKGLETQFVANNLNEKASKKFEDASATLKAQNNAATVVGSDGKKVSATKDSNTEASVATAKGKDAQGEKTGKGNFVGTAEQHEGTVEVAPDAQGHSGTIEGAKGKTLDVVRNKGDRKFGAANEKINGEATLDSHSAAGGDGTVEYEGKSDKAFTYAKEGEDLKATFGDDQQSLGRSTKMWNCGAMKQGVSTCVDQNGRSVGEVVVDSDGKATVYKMVGNSKVKIGAGNAVKNADGTYTIGLNSKDSDKVGLFTGTVGDFKKGSCYQEVTGKRERKAPEAEITRLDIFYNSANLSDTKTTINFPDCFDVVAEVRVSQSVNVEDLAIEFDVNASPLGKLKCFDSAACSTGCYYCDLCSLEERKETQNVCPSKGGRTFNVKTTVCPPAEDTELLQCARFDRSLLSQGLKKGDTKSIEAKALLWQRAVETDKLEKKYFAAQGKGRVTTVFNAAISAQYLKEHPGTKWDDVQPAQRLAFYIRKNSRESLLACQEGELDYQIGGSKVDTDVLLNFGQAAKDAQDGELSLFSPQPCDEYTQAQAAEYAKVEAEHTSSGGGILSGLSSLLNRG